MPLDQGLRQQPFGQMLETANQSSLQRHYYRIEPSCSTAPSACVQGTETRTPPKCASTKECYPSTPHCHGSWRCSRRFVPVHDIWRTVVPCPGVRQRQYSTPLAGGRALALLPRIGLLRQRL